MNFHSWFRPIARGSREDSLITTRIEIAPEKLAMWKRPRAVITVPRTCGTAVQRNRLRRVLRSHLREKGDVGHLWIRLLGQHKLEKKILLRDWQPIVERALSKLPL